MFGVFDIRMPLINPLYIIYTHRLYLPGWASLIVIRIEIPYFGNPVSNMEFFLGYYVVDPCWYLIFKLACR